MDLSAAGHWAGRTDGRKNLFKREKNLPVVILSFREQTLTNNIQGVRNHLTWEKEPAHPPARRAETSPQEANSQETYPKVKGNNTATATHWAQVRQQQQAQSRSSSVDREKARVVKRHKERKPYA